MINTTHDILGKLTILKHNASGNLIDQRVTHNSITTAGRQLVADLFTFNINGDKEDKIKRISKMHLGGSQAPFNAAHKGLLDEIGQTDIISFEPVPTGNDRIQIRIVGELGTDDCNGELKEAGLFTDGAQPIMYNRVTFDTITKSQEFKLTLIWDLTF